jgi:hypothetical protein
MNNMQSRLGLIFLLTGLFCMSTQVVSAQTNNSNSTNKMKVPSQLDIESQTTEQELANINNSPGLS